MYDSCSSLCFGSDSSATYSAKRLRNVSSRKALSNCLASSAESTTSSCECSFAGGGRMTLGAVAVAVDASL